MNTHFHKTSTDQIAFFDNENQNKITLVFIHGFPFNKSMWLPQVEYFNSKFRCIALDVKGHGESKSNVENFSIDAFSDDIRNLLEHLKIEKAIFVGLSMGGYIALNLVTRFPKMIAGLVLSDTNCLADSPEAIEKRMKTIESLPKIGREVYAKESVKNLFAPDSLKTKTEQVQLIQNMIANTEEKTIIKTLKALANRDETCSKLVNIDAPSLILVGEHDLITPFSQAEILWDKISNSELFVIENAGHIANLENEDEFNRILDDFLSRIF